MGSSSTFGAPPQILLCKETEEFQGGDSETGIFILEPFTYSLFTSLVWTSQSELEFLHDRTRHFDILHVTGHCRLVWFGELRSQTT